MPSVVGLFKNFFLTGVLKNKFRTIIVVPVGTPTSVHSTSLAPSITYLTPVSESAVLVINSTCETAAILDSASPLNPSVETYAKSLASVNLLVACR